tara:strand:+ start:151 stop:423 length:273 start_codon:yes stop_codon:yes gene_type:complete
MTKLLQQNDNGVIYVENNQGDVFGIVSSLKVIDWDGMPFSEDSFTVLERNGFILGQNWDDESAYIDFPQENGETARVVFSGDSVEIVEAN